jgi:DNA-binding NtrC family response regulator
MVAVAAPTPLSVLIQGPTGSGKELVAAAIHARSGRNGRFVAFNVCAITEAMFEDALFGHVRGAFTGAVADSPGFLLEAHGGTAFLDEVSGLPAAQQSKLLRAVETGQFRPVGARRDAQSDFRVVAATNEDMERLVREGRFRDDLAHRLRAIVIHVPPLSTRLEDIPLLVREFLIRAGKPNVIVAPDAIRILQEHAWPGNIRQLKQVIELAMAMSAIDDGRYLSTEGVVAALDHRGASTVSTEPSTYLLERQRVLEVVERYRGDTEQAARELGVHRATVYRWIKRLQIPVKDLRETPLAAVRS